MRTHYYSYYGILVCILVHVVQQVLCCTTTTTTVTGHKQLPCMLYIQHSVTSKADIYNYIDNVYLVRQMIIGNFHALMMQIIRHYRIRN